MHYTSSTKLTRFFSALFCSVVCAGVLCLLLPYLPPLGRLIAAVVLCCVAAFVFSFFSRFFGGRIKRYYFQEGDTRLLEDFARKLRFCYTLEDLIEAIQQSLEVEADCSVLYVNMDNHYVIYNTSAIITTSPDTLQSFSRNFGSSYPDGYYFIDEELGLVSMPEHARGFFLVHGKLHFYVLCRYTHVFEEEVFQTLWDELVAYEKRANIISDLTSISELSKEWAMVADTQQSFLPKKLSGIPGVDVAAYYRPLVNVSGDYYDVIPLSDHRTLFMLGDVSGKGLAAALVMGIVMNTMQILGDKEDLIHAVRSVDAAIKDMHLQDKYTVLFVGVVDTKAMTIEYVNASMADPLIISRSGADRVIKPLGSNCGVVGIIDIEDIRVDKAKLNKGDVILMASDGISEVMDESGVELGDTELYVDTIKSLAQNSAQEFVNGLSNLVLTYNGDKKLRDDVTMLVVKMED